MGIVEDLKSDKREVTRVFKTRSPETYAAESRACSFREGTSPVPCAVAMTQEQSLLRYPRGPEGGKNQIEDHIGYLAEIDLETSTATTATGLVTSIVTSEATTTDVRPGRSATQSPGSDFPEEIFGVD